MADRLLEDFAPVSKAEWLERIARDLKGKPYEKLIRVNDSGIPIAPVYTAEDLPADVDKSYPGMDDMRRHQSLLGDDGWIIAQDFGCATVGEFEGFVREILGANGGELAEENARNGARAVRVRLADAYAEAMREPQSAPSGGLLVQDWADLQPILDGAKDGSYLLYLELGDAALDFLDSGWVGSWKGGMDLNPLRYCREGNPDEGLLAAILPKIAQVAAALPPRQHFFLYTLSLQELELTGANAAQQIAFALAMETDLADRMHKHGIPPLHTFERTSIQMPVTTDFFGEIAKFRAFRVLHERVMTAWGIENQQEVGHVQAVPARSHETIADPHVNLLRHTTEAMAAAIGGCQMLCLPAFDRTYQDAGLDALRIARNIQLILRNESYFGNVIDVAGGAYFVENLTDALAAKAWGIFQEIEAAGGWYKFVDQGKLAPMLAEGKRKRLHAVRTGAKSILGTNTFANERESLPTSAFKGNTSAESSPLLARLRAFQQSLGILNPSYDTQRLAHAFEAVRRKMQAYDAAQPGVRQALLLTMGDPVLRGARATFARNVLAAGGYACSENAHPNDLHAATAAAAQLNPTVIVLCAADADYLGGQGSSWLDGIRAAVPQAILILAGKPEGWEALQAHGISEPIFAGMDRIDFLERLFEQVKTRKEARP